MLTIRNHSIAAVAAIFAALLCVSTSTSIGVTAAAAHTASTVG